MNPTTKPSWLKRWLFAAELAEIERLREELDESREREQEQFRRLTLKLRAAEAQIPRQPRTARLSAKPRHAEAEVRQILAGTRDVGHVSALLSVVEAAVVAASDRALDPPAEGYTTPGGQHVPGYSAELRTHHAGGASALADLLAQLQELTAPEEKPPAG